MIENYFRIVLIQFGFKHNLKFSCASLKSTVLCDTMKIILGKLKLIFSKFNRFYLVYLYEKLLYKKNNIIIILMIIL